MTIYRIIIHFGGTLDTEDFGFVFSDKKVAIEAILDMSKRRVAYGVEEEGSYVELLEEHDEKGRFYTKHTTRIRFDK